MVCAVSAGVVPAYYGGASEQHHSQDDHGNYVYGYSDPNSRREETGTYGGDVVKGSYSYTAPDGSIVHNDYFADANGFRSSLAPTAPHDVHPAPEYAHAHYGHVAYAGLGHHPALPVAPVTPVHQAGVGIYHGLSPFTYSSHHAAGYGAGHHDIAVRTDLPLVPRSLDIGINGAHGSVHIAGPKGDVKVSQGPGGFSYGITRALPGYYHY